MKHIYNTYTNVDTSINPKPNDGKQTKIYFTQQIFIL